MVAKFLRFAPVLCALAATPAHAREVKLTMANMSYGTIPADLVVGDVLVWTNADTVPHTVTARDHSFDVRIAPRQTVRQSLDKPGAFAFFCIYHSMMRGTLKVAAKPPA